MNPKHTISALASCNPQVGCYFGLFCFRNNSSRFCFIASSRNAFCLAHSLKRNASLTFSVGPVWTVSCTTSKGLLLTREFANKSEAKEHSTREGLAWLITDTDRCETLIAGPRRNGCTKLEMIFPRTSVHGATIGIASATGMAQKNAISIVEMCISMERLACILGSALELINQI